MTFDIVVGCAGCVYGLDIADSFIKSGKAKHALVVGVEIISKLVDWEDRRTCVLFGDGAGAAVLGQVEDGYGILSFDLGSDGSGGDAIQIPSSGSRLPVSKETIDQRLNLIHMNGKEVFKFAVKAMGNTVKHSLEKIDMPQEQIDWLVPHQANIRIIQSAAKRLAMPMDKVILTVQKYGNMSAACIPIALAEAAAEKRFKKGDIIALSGFGAGLTWASCIIRWSKED
jgi:3-oxoacyl-[acyl-carrier-protein] synthase-3